MKHIFVFIDKIIYLVNHLPPYLKSPKDLKMAEKVLNLLREYEEILKVLIHAHKNEVHLKKLRELHIHEVDNWASQITVLFEKLDDVLVGLDKDLFTLTHILEVQHFKGKFPFKDLGWHHVISDIAMGFICNQLDDANKNLDHFRRATVFELDELNKLIKHKGHLSSIDKWLAYLDLSDDEQMLEHQKYFADLIGK